MNSKNNKSLNNQALTAANGITLLRILGTVVLLLLDKFSPLFFAVYTFTGLTDALDGWVARRTNTAGEFGARLDSIADLLFYAVMLIKFVPFLWESLPKALWAAAAVVLAIRIGSYLTAAVRYHRFACLHTYLNKITGAAVFLLPYALMFSKGIAYCAVICALALVASLEELAMHIFCKGYCADRKSIFQPQKNGATR